MAAFIGQPDEYNWAPYQNDDGSIEMRPFSLEGDVRSGDKTTPPGRTLSLAPWEQQAQGPGIGSIPAVPAQAAPLPAPEAAPAEQQLTRDLGAPASFGGMQLDTPDIFKPSEFEPQASAVNQPPADVSNSNSLGVSVREKSYKNVPPPPDVESAAIAEADRVNAATGWQQRAAERVTDAQVAYDEDVAKRNSLVADKQVEQQNLLDARQAQLDKVTKVAQDEADATWKRVREVNPNEVWQGAGGVAGIVAATLSGFLAPYNGGRNMALEQIQQMAELSVRSQMANQEKDQAAAYRADRNVDDVRAANKDKYAEYKELMAKHLQAYSAELAKKSAGIKSQVERAKLDAVKADLSALNAQNINEISQRFVANQMGIWDKQVQASLQERSMAFQASQANKQRQHELDMEARRRAGAGGPPVANMISPELGIKVAGTKDTPVVVMDEVSKRKYEATLESNNRSLDRLDASEALLKDSGMWDKLSKGAKSVLMDQLVNTGAIETLRNIQGLSQEADWQRVLTANGGDLSAWFSKVSDEEKLAAIRQRKTLLKGEQQGIANQIIMYDGAGNRLKGQWDRPPTNPEIKAEFESLRKYGAEGTPQTPPNLKERTDAFVSAATPEAKLQTVPDILSKLSLDTKEARKEPDNEKSGILFRRALEATHQLEKKIEALPEGKDKAKQKQELRKLQLDLLEQQKERADLVRLRPGEIEKFYGQPTPGFKLSNPLEKAN